MYIGNLLRTSNTLRVATRNRYRHTNIHDCSVFVFGRVIEMRCAFYGRPRERYLIESCLDNKVFVAEHHNGRMSGVGVNFN